MYQVSRLWMKKGSKWRTIIQLPIPQNHHRVIKVKQEVASPAPLLKPVSHKTARGSSGLMGAVHRIIKAPPLWKAPHYNCSSLPTPVLYLQAQNQVQYSQCNLGIPVQGSSCFTWPGAVLLVMQPQTASAACFKGTLPACGQSICWDLWRSQWKLRKRRFCRLGLYLRTSYLCAQSLNLSCSATHQHFPCLFFYCPSSGRRLPCCPQHPFPLSTPGELWLS